MSLVQFDYFILIKIFEMFKLKKNNQHSKNDTVIVYAAANVEFN